MAKRKKTDIVGLKLRLREHLRARLETAAKAQERSLNSEVVARLEESFAEERRRRDDQKLLAQFVDSVKQTLQEHDQQGGKS